VVPSRWINPADGTVNAGGFYYGQDVRPCNAAAQVDVRAQDGLGRHHRRGRRIVHSLPGQPRRNYIVVCCATGTDYIA